MNPKLKAELNELRINPLYGSERFPDRNLEEWEKWEIAYDVVRERERELHWGINSTIVLLVVGNVLFWSVVGYYFYQFLNGIIAW